VGLILPAPGLSDRTNNDYYSGDATRGLDSRTLALNVAHDLRRKGAIRSQTHVRSESGMRLPPSRGTGSSLLEHAIDLLERKTLGLGDEEVSVDESAGAKTTPDEEDLGTQVTLVGTDHVGSDDGDDAVPEPVGGGGEGNPTRADGEREDLADDDPSAGTPGGGEEEDEDTDECDLGFHGVGIAAVDGTGDGDDELADDHSQGAPEEERAAAEALDGPEGDGGGADIDEGGDKTDEEGVVDSTEILEEGGAEVEDEVDAGPLLHHLHGSTQDCAAQIAVSLPKRSLEAIGPAGEIAALWGHLQFVFMVGNDLGQFLLDIFRVPRLATETGQHVGGAFDVAAFDEVSGRFREKEKPDSCT
jgi:hypothetical protein